MDRQPSLHDQSIEDFGEQWARYQDNDGYYGSSDLFQDMLTGLMQPDEFRDREVLDVGSGTGRIVQMLLDAGASRVHAVEPSKAIDVLRKNLADQADRVQCHQVPGTRFPELDVDVAVCIGVLHHIPEPEPVVRNVFAALKPGGKFLFWVYGREGNEAYLSWVLPLRKLTAVMPDVLLRGLCHVMNVGLALYIFLCRFLPLPLHDYVTNVIGRFSWRKRFLVIFDQLNPCYARYYTGDEAEELMRQAGFDQIRIAQRHGYSWTVVGVKPTGDVAA